MPETLNQGACSSCGSPKEAGHMKGCEVAMAELEGKLDESKKGLDEAVGAVEEYAKKEKPELPGLDF